MKGFTSLSPAVVGRLRHIDHAADVSDGLALGDQLLGRFELTDDLLGCVTGVFHVGVPGPAWPDEDSHSPWTDLRGPRQEQDAQCSNRLVDRPGKELSQADGEACPETSCNREQAQKA
jgi:hypothetical protein